MEIVLINIDTGCCYHYYCISFDMFLQLKSKLHNSSLYIVLPYENICEKRVEKFHNDGRSQNFSHNFVSDMYL